MRPLPLYAGFFVALALSTAAYAQEASCSFPTPDGFVERAEAGAQKSVVEQIAREKIVTKSWLTLREATPGSLDDGIKAARAEERADGVELVREGPLPNAQYSNHLLVYRYLKNGRPVLRFHAVFALGFRTVHFVGESQATIIDALELPNREAGLHERWMRQAMSALRCH